MSELLRLDKNEQEIVIFSLENVGGTTFLNMHIFQKNGKAIVPTEKFSSIRLDRFRENLQQLEQEAIQLKEVFIKVDKLLTSKGLLVSPELKNQPGPLQKEFCRTQPF